MTDQEIYDKASPEAKRRLAAKLMGWILRANEIDPKEFWRYEKAVKGKYGLAYNSWKPDQLLDQCRLLENKAKGDEKVWVKYGEAIENILVPSLLIGEIGWQADIANTASLTADKKLFALFQAFDVNFSTLQGEK